MNTDSAWSKQKACFDHVEHVRRMNSIFEACIARASELGSCQSNLCRS